MITTLKNRVLKGGEITPAEALQLAASPHKEELYEAAREITQQLCGAKFDLCSIINAKSGKCPENCKWCAQSAHYKTKAEVYDLLDRAECLKWAQHNHAQGVGRYALVTSGKRLTTSQVEQCAEIYREIAAACPIELCASMGLLDRERLSLLKQAGVNRYHCNLETAPSYFEKLCSTHTQAQKIETIRAAQSLGMEVCSGGIIGMGESMEQRIELALLLRELQIHSIPINLLQPIEGTPLAGTPPLTSEEILTTMALFRFINPTAWLRFAGGRAQMDSDTLHRALTIAMNSAIVGDMLTTTGSRIQQDKTLFTQIGYTL